jgi:hypothetical protein
MGMTDLFWLKSQKQCCVSGSAWIRIHLAVLDPYPDPYWEWGSGSLSMEIDQNLQINLVSCRRLRFGSAWIRIGLAPWVQISIEIKSSIRIRIGPCRSTIKRPKRTYFEVAITAISDSRPPPPPTLAEFLLCFICVSALANRKPSEI